MATPLIDRVNSDPFAFGATFLCRRRWKGQRDIVRALRGHRRLRIQSGNATGKTHELAAQIIEFLVTVPDRKAVIGGPSYGQVRHGIWDEMLKAWDLALRNGYRLSKDRPGVDEWKLNNGSMAFISSPDNISSVQGGRGANGTLIVGDEAQGIQDANLWDAWESLMQSGNSRLVTSCNPLFPQGVDYENSLSDEWHTLTIDSLAHPNVVTGREVIPGAVTRLWIEERRKRWGEDDPRWIARILGQYPTAGSNSLFTRGLIDRAASIMPTRKDGRHLGIDVAGEGGDENVATLIEDLVVKSVTTWSGIDPMGTVGKIIQLMRSTDTPATNVHIDSTGMGSGIVARLHEQGYAVDGVNFAESPRGDWDGLLLGQTALNRRVEMYLVAAQLLRDGQLKISAEYESTIKDLCATSAIAPHSSGATRLEDKDRIKKRLGRSPDHGDSLVLALSRTGNISAIPLWI